MVIFVMFELISLKLSLPHSSVSWILILGWNKHGEPIFLGKLNTINHNLIACIINKFKKHNVREIQLQGPFNPMTCDIY